MTELLQTHTGHRSLRPGTVRAQPRALAGWLFFVAALVFAMVVVGGITRLTESGLSIVEWKPVSGTLPPLSHTDWQAAFDAYKTTSQYRLLNRGMALGDFQQIFFWEYVHRLLGRAIGVVMAGVLLVFWWRRAIPVGHGRRMVVILALGGLQGAIGWWMVASGLKDRTEVSHIRLAIHLLNALLIYGVLIWCALDLARLARDPAARTARLTGHAVVAIAILVLQLLLGAFTAGLRAGYAFSSWPRMGDDWFPAGGWQTSRSLIGNLVYNPIAVQFLHRWWAWVAAIAVLSVAAAAKRAGAGAAATLIAASVAAQILLGIATLLTGVAIPVAVAHQACATLLLGALLWGAHAIGRRTGPVPAAS